MNLQDLKLQAWNQIQCLINNQVSDQLLYNSSGIVLGQVVDQFSDQVWGHVWYQSWVQQNE